MSGPGGPAIALVIVWSLFPVYWALNTSLMTNAQAQSTPTHFFPIRPIFANYQAIFGAGPQSAEAAGGIGRSLVNIVVESGGATLLTLVIAILGAYAFARLRFRLKNLFFYTVLGHAHPPGVRDAHSALPDHERGGTRQHLPRHHPRLRIGVHASRHVDHVQRLSRAPSEHRGGGRHRRGVDAPDVLQDGAPHREAGDRCDRDHHVPSGLGAVHFPLVLSSTGSTQPLTVVLAALEGRHVVPYTIINAAAIVAIAIPAVLVFLLNRWIVEGIIAGSVK